MLMELTFALGLVAIFGGLTLMMLHDRRTGGLMDPDDALGPDVSEAIRRRLARAQDDGVCPSEWRVDELTYSRVLNWADGAHSMRYCPERRGWELVGLPVQVVHSSGWSREFTLVAIDAVGVPRYYD